MPAKKTSAAPSPTDQSDQSAQSERSLYQDLAKTLKALGFEILASATGAYLKARIAYDQPTDARLAAFAAAIDAGVTDLRLFADVDGDLLIIKLPQPSPKKND